MKNKKLVVYDDGAWFVLSGSEYSPAAYSEEPVITTAPVDQIIDEAASNKAQAFITKHAGLLLFISNLLILLVGWAQGKYGLLELIQRLFT